MVTVKDSILLNMNCHVKMAKEFKIKGDIEQSEECTRIAKCFKKQLEALSIQDLEKEDGNLPVGYIPKLVNYKNKNNEQFEFEFEWSKDNE